MASCPSVTPDKPGPSRKQAPPGQPAPIIVLRGRVGRLEGLIAAVALAAAHGADVEDLAASAHLGAAVDLRRGCRDGLVGLLAEADTLGSAAFFSGAAHGAGAAGFGTGGCSGSA